MVALRLVYRLLLILCAFSPLLGAYDLRVGPRAENEDETLGPLGVTLDYNMASTWPKEKIRKGSSVQRNWVYSSRIRFFGFEGAETRLTDGQLWQIARDAWMEIDADMQYYGIGKKFKPKAMSVLAFPNELILVSSQRGLNSFAYDYPQSKVVKTLRLCQAVWRDTMGMDGTHGNDASCGEVMAAHLYYTQHTMPLSERNSRIVTLVNGNQIGPCAGANRAKDTWACNLFVAAEGLNYLDTNIKPQTYDLSKVTGQAPDIDQIPLCTGSISKEV
ncbi:hypothetical protein BJY00DRAFT_64690 [Aspergillus carlsbadensis]|nr:hypothetical protein BJY00DRAFT_64690 [Aspergillus carlsbadensis]